MGEALSGALSWTSSETISGGEGKEERGRRGEGEEERTWERMHNPNTSLVPRPHPERREGLGSGHF